MSTTRREFMKASAVAGVTAAASLSVLNNVHAGGSDEIRVGVIGMTSAVLDLMKK